MLTSMSLSADGTAQSRLHPRLPWLGRRQCSRSWSHQVACRFVRSGVRELACQSCALDQPAPAFAPAMLARDLTSGRKRAITGPVGERPSPCLTLQPARWRRSIRGARPGRCVVHGQARSRALPVAGRVAAAYLTGQQFKRRGEGERRPGRDDAPGQRRLGHRDVGGQARDAPRHQQRPRQCCAAPASPRLGQQRGRCGHDHPIDRQRRERGDLPGLPMQRHEPVHVKVGHRARDQRQQRHASGRGPPDPALRPPGHRCPPRTSSPVMAGMYVPGDSLSDTLIPTSGRSRACGIVTRAQPPAAAGVSFSLFPRRSTFPCPGARECLRGPCR